MASLTHIATTLIVPPPSSSHPSVMPLSHYDLLMQHIQYSQCLLLYRHHCSPATLPSFLHTLKSSLSHTLLHFYPLAGRLRYSPSHGLHVLCNDAGVEFIEASADATLSDMAGYNTKNPLFFQLLPRTRAFNKEGFRLPLLSIQVTKLQEDGIAIGFAFNHLLVDGYSAFHFKVSWAELFHGKPSISLLPVYDKFALAYGSTDGIPVMRDDDEDLHGAVIRPSTLLERVFHFSPEAIAELKKQANEGRIEKGLKMISVYQALSAYLWKLITIARELDPETVSLHKLSVDCRKRLTPPAPDGYFGNAISTVYVRATAKELMKEGNLQDIAEILHNAIGAYNEEAIACTMNELKKRSHAFNVGEGGNGKDVHVGSSFRFPTHDCDFGFGGPIAVRSGIANKCDGKITMQSCGGLQSGVDVEITLSKEPLHALERLMAPLTNKTLI